MVKKFKVQLTLAKANGEMGKTTIHNLRTRQGAEKFFEECLALKNLWGATLLDRDGKEISASCDMPTD